MTPDLRLLHQYASTGDAEAFSAIVQAYQDLVYSACLRMLGNAADAEDAAQDCFYDLARQAGKVRSSVAGWLHRRATHHCLELVRQAAARKRREREYEEMRAAERAARNDGVSWEEIAPEVDRAVDELPNEERHALVEHFLRQRTQAEIAEELGVSAATVSRRVNSGVEQVRNRLKDAGVVVPSAVLAALLAQNAAGAAPATLAAAVSTLSAEAAARGSGKSAPTSSHLTSHLPGALRGKAAVAVALGLPAIIGGTVYWQAARAKREAAGHGGYENGVNANVRREAQGESRQVLLENVVQTFDQVVRETVQPYGAPRSAVTTHLVCMRAAGWEDADYETLMTISGFGISFVYEHKDKFWVAWVPPPGADERIARATGFGWEWVRSQTPDEVWNALKKTIDAGKPARAPSEE